MLLNFWQSWSAPCLTELCRLQRLHQAGREAPFIVAFHGGKNSKALDEIRKRLGLSFPLVQDLQQRIARQYGVRCWPTTIMVDAEGRVEHVQFGVCHDAVSSDPMGATSVTC
jgi:peroxiredoxin